MKNESYTIELKLEFEHDPSGDEYLKKNPDSSTPGSFWRMSFMSAKSPSGENLIKFETFQHDMLNRAGGLPRLMDEVKALLIRVIQVNKLKGV